MKPSEIDQRYLEEITASRFPVIEDEAPPMRIDITGVGEEPAAAEEVKPELVAPVVAPDSPSMTAYDPTVRERLAEFLQAGFESFGMERFQARRQAQSLVGGPSSNLPLQLGVADIVPFLGTGLQTEEAGRMLEDAADFAQRGEYGEAAISAAVGALGLVPGAAGTVKAARQVGEMANVAGDKAVQAITGNPQATAMGALEAAGQMSPVSRIAPGVEPQAAAPRSNIGFYSAVEETVANLPQAKGTGAQFLAQIGKTAGVKPEELKWTGLDDFLKGKKSVTKAEVQDYLAANRVDVQEVRLGELSAEQSLAMEQAKNRYREIKAAVRDISQKVEDGLLSSKEARALRQPLISEASRLDSEMLFGAAPAKTKFSQYTLPGGENYREILLTLPQKGGDDLIAAEQKRDMLAKQTADMMEEWKSLSEQMPGDPRVVELYQRLSETRRQRDNAVVDARELRAASEAQTYRSSHFNQPNILAHMRVNDRVVDGKKTLFIEEIQSDWHQAGRKKGYAQNISEDDVKGLLNNEGYNVKYNGANWVVTSKDGSPVPNKLAGGQDKNQFAGNLNQVAAIVLGRRDLMPSRSGSGIGPVPDAPFKTSWHELSLKRAIQEASEKGYDQIAFTTGKTQVERYPQALRQVADDISWSNIDESGRKYVDIKKDGNIVLQASIDQSGKIYQSSVQDAYGKTLDEVIGKPMAQRIASETQGTIKGEEFTVGGKGMEGFYDNILPKSLDKLAKKFDAKVGKTFIEGERTRDASGIPSMYPEKIEVWSMDITPKMRESVTTKGQPLFQVGVGAGAAAGAAAMQDNEEQM